MAGRWTSCCEAAARSAGHNPDPRPHSALGARRTTRLPYLLACFTTRAVRSRAPSPNRGLERMKRSTDRILTTHMGSLPRPDMLADLLVAQAEGKEVDAARIP